MRRELTGLKSSTEVMDYIVVVEEHCVRGEADSTRPGGFHTRENVGMSSER